MTTSRFNFCDSRNNFSNKEQAFCNKSELMTVDELQRFQVELGCKCKCICNLQPKIEVYTQLNSKVVATNMANFALAGFMLDVGQSGDFTVYRNGRGWYCQDADALSTFAFSLGITYI
jgi:hypothetical protein